MPDFAPSLTGRFSHSTPKHQNIPLPWSDSINRCQRQLAALSRQHGLPVFTATQRRIKVNDLVAWKALSKEGLWRVVEIRESEVFTSADYTAFETRIAATYIMEPKTVNPRNEITLSKGDKCNLSPEPDMLVLEWVGGPCGVTSNIGALLVVPTAEVRPVTEMDAIAIAASE